jgi:phosphate transport system permease protein
MALTTAPGGVPDLSSQLRRSRTIKNALSSWWMWLSLITAVVPLVFVVGYVLVEGLQVMSWQFLTSNIQPSARRAEGGIWPAIAGTALMTLGASAMAIPLGILGAVYLNEYGGSGRLARTIRFMADVMTGVPSIVMGLFIYTVWVLAFGQSGFAGSLALAALMLPVVIRSTEEMLRLVPDELRHGAYALGTRKWRAVATVVLPAALPGITSGVMLAVARAAGETAPLLFTTGIVYTANPNLFSGSNTALSILIFGNANSPFETAQARAWGAALTLIVIVLMLTVAARMIANRYAIKER